MLVSPVDSLVGVYLRLALIMLGYKDSYSICIAGGQTIKLKIRRKMSAIKNTETYWYPEKRLVVWICVK